MSRLPTVGDDLNAWGTVLNDFLSVSLNSDGTLKSSGGSTTFVLSASALSGSTSFTISQAPPASVGLFAIETDSANCEVLRVSSATGTALTTTFATKKTHASGVKVVWLPTLSCPATYFGAKLDGVTDDTAAIQAGVNATQRANVWLEGMGRDTGIAEISSPIACPANTRITRMIIRANAATFAPIDAIGAMLVQTQDGPTDFTADPATDTFTTTSAHGIGSVGNKIMFTGSALPSPLVSGRVYYVDTKPSTTTFTISATSGGAIFDLTTSGSGIAYGDTLVLSRIYLSDVTLNGSSATSGGLYLNGVAGTYQQPMMWRDVRFDGFGGVSLDLNYGGQIGYFYNIEINPPNVATAIGIRLTGTGYEFYGTNITGDGVGTGIQLNGAIYCGFFGLWLEQVDYGIDFQPGSNWALTFDNVSISLQNTGIGVYVRTGSVSNSSFSLRHTRLSNSATLISDTDRGITVAGIDLNTQKALVSYDQPAGNVAPVIRPEKTTGAFAVTATPYTVIQPDRTLIFNATAASITANLPTAATNGRRITFKKTDASVNTVTLVPTGAEQIDGAASYPLTTQYQWVTVEAQSTGTGWRIVG